MLGVLTTVLTLAEAVAVAALAVTWLLRPEAKVVTREDRIWGLVGAGLIGFAAVLSAVLGEWLIAAISAVWAAIEAAMVLVDRQPTKAV